MPGTINRGRGAKAEVEEGQRQEEGEIQHRIHWSKLTGRSKLTRYYPNEVIEYKITNYFWNCMFKKLVKFLFNHK